jgi:hypothetical protein
MERMVVSTYGSFLADSLSNWSQQVEDSFLFAEITVSVLAAE